MKNTVILGIVVVVIVIAAGAYFVANMGSRSQTANSSIPTTSPSSTAYTTVAASTSIVGSGTNSSPMIPYYTVNVSFSAQLGNYLTNSTGWTLYIYTKDTPNNGNSTCYSTCATYWPPFYVNGSTLSIPSNLNESAFSTIKRTDGTIQLTYKGYPLYYYAGDKKAGDTNGQGLGGNWFAATVPDLTTST